MKRIISISILLLAVCVFVSAYAQSYKIVDTGQKACYDNTREISAPQKGSDFYGQDAQVNGLQPSYRDNGNGTVTDLNTGLMWQKMLPPEKYTQAECAAYADTCTVGGYTDWRLPTIKELYSLILFSGKTGMTEAECIPYINTDYFDFRFGGTVNPDERIIDAQYATSTIYKGYTMNGNETMFGVNFVDGRIKGYPVFKDFDLRLVRGSSSYGINDFTDNGDGTITDNATGLMWDRGGSAKGMNWQDALAWARQMNAENYLGYSDWRLPNAKELQSVVDYGRSPQYTGTAAIDPLFTVPEITDEEGNKNYPFYWTSTTHYDGPGPIRAAYVCFGEALGYWQYAWTDVHGAGAQRSDPKTGDPADYPYGFGPQGDAIRIYNFVRLVRDSDGTVPGGSGDDSGYTLFAPVGSQTTYLIQNDGSVYNSWTSSYRPALSAYLLDDGSLLRTASLGLNQVFGQTAGGLVEKFSWEGGKLWEYEYSSNDYVLHHDIEFLPNGNILMIAWERKSESEAIAAGRDPSLIDAGELWADKIIEVAPSGSSGGSIVWEWHAWDHLVQDFDQSKSNYGTVADHPERIDINFYSNKPGADWMHTNAVDYNPDLDQILLTIHNFSEVWIIDHSATTAEAAGSSGDLLYRWGNPQAYGRGTADDQKLFVPHDGRWIEEGLPGAGNILVFNNGQGRPGGNYSSVEEFTPPENGSGSYTLDTGLAYGPSATLWQYIDDPPDNFYADHISGAQRMPDGNTLICSGPDGIFFEVNSGGATVWEYTNPYSSSTPQGESSSVFRAVRYPAAYVSAVTTGIDNDASAGSFVPANFRLSQNYPNPFNPSTTIPFTLSRASRVTLTVYNLLGQKIKTLLSGAWQPGSHSAKWDGTNDSGRPVAAGIYLCRIAAVSRQALIKMSLLK